MRILDEIHYFSSVSIQNEKSKKDFYLFKNREILKSLDIRQEKIAEEMYFELTHKKGDWKLFPETARILQRLSSNGHTLALASNFDANLKTIVHELGISEFFQVIQVSAEINVEKPNLLFFRILMDQIPSNLGETYFIGDNKKLDYDPALESGFIPILLDPYVIHPSIPGRIETLNEILSIAGE
jgi:putative hydrolase of the HAD superfamily